MSDLRPDSLLFVLGLQRSGTTWITNILDASPETLVFIEPFAPDFGLFPEVPEQGLYLDSAPPETARRLRADTFERLYDRKHLFSRRSLTDPGWFRAERAVARLALALRRGLPSSLVRRVRQFKLLNLNRFEASHPLRPKSARPRHAVIKELRVAGQIPLLTSAYPDARLLVLIRSPHATVDSVLRWFSRGRLSEVRRHLESFVETLECQSLADRYGDVLPRARGGGMAHRAALWWRVSYEEMVRSVAAVPASRIIAYEEIASRPEETMRDLFRWAGIPWGDDVGDYLAYSSEREVADPGPTNTVRRSATYFSSWRDTISPDVREAVDEIVGGSVLLDYFTPFYQT